jgi:hypothetical protein
MKQAIVLGTLLLAMAFAPAATAEPAEIEIAAPEHLNCYLDPTPPGAWLDCIAETGLNEAIDTVQWACRTAGYSC